MSKPRLKSLLAVYVILCRGEEILLLRRANTGYRDGQWNVPAGHVEEGEDLIKAALREAKEEAGVDILPRDLQLFYIMHRYAKEPVYVDFFFKTATWQGEAEIAEPQKCDGLMWAPLSSLPKDLVEYYKKPLASIETGQWFYESSLSG